LVKPVLEDANGAQLTPNCIFLQFGSNLFGVRPA
jgi:hypothetical protein